MHTVVILLRGINVGGKNRLPMADLKQVLQSLKLEDVATYIQSGNAVARSRRKPTAKLVSKIATAIEDAHGFAPDVMVLTAEQLDHAMKRNPFPDAEDAPKTLHLFFLDKPTKNPDLAAIKKAQVATEQFKLTDAVFYLHAPDGIGRSKLAATAEKFLGVTTTARNWRTVLKLKELADES